MSMNGISGNGRFPDRTGTSNSINNSFIGGAIILQLDDP
jgi:hypothetical protein